MKNKNNLALGMAIGIAIGSAIGVALGAGIGSRLNQKKKNQDWFKLQSYPRNGKEKVANNKAYGCQSG